MTTQTKERHKATKPKYKVFDEVWFFKNNNNGVTELKSGEVLAVFVQQGYIHGGVRFLDIKSYIVSGKGDKAVYEEVLFKSKEDALKSL